MRESGGSDRCSLKHQDRQRERLMQGWIDMHCHILPGLDDGARDIETALQILELVYAEGIRAMIATPHFHGGHYEASPEQISEWVIRIQDLVSERFPDLKIFSGNEIYYYDSMIDWVGEDRVLTMAGSCYLLLEFSPLVEFKKLEQAVRNVKAGGYLPILAHIERYRCLNGHMKQIQQLIDMGAYIQINTEAILGDAGLITKQFVKKLCKNDMIDFMATDTHSLHRRRPRMKECAEYLTKHYGEAYTQKILYDNPYCIITDEYIEH